MVHKNKTLNETQMPVHFSHCVDELVDTSMAMCVHTVSAEQLNMLKKGVGEGFSGLLNKQVHSLL